MSSKKYDFKSFNLLMNTLVLRYGHPRRVSFTGLAVVEPYSYMELRSIEVISGLVDLHILGRLHDSLNDIHIEYRTCLSTIHSKEFPYLGSSARAGYRAFVTAL